MRTSFLAAVTTGILLAACNSAAPVATDRGNLGARLDVVERALHDDLAAKRMPGAVVQIHHRGRIARTFVVGQLNPATGVPMREDAIFRIYSMTKPVVSVAAMILVEEGRMALASPIATIIPELKDLQVAEAPKDGGADAKPVLLRAKRQPTVHDLLKHTSGFTSATGAGVVPPMYEKAGVDLDTLQGSDAFLKALAGLPLAYHPGTTWEYGVSTDVLGIVIERVTKRPLGTFLKERIFDPLRMVDTGFVVREADFARIAEPFEKAPNGQPIQLWDVRKPRAIDSGGGALVSTAADYMRFARMLLNGGELDGARVLSRKSVEFITADHLNGISGPNYFFGEGYGFGLGLAVRTHAGVYHSLGSVGDYFWVGYGGTMFWVDPKEQLIVLLMTQAPGMQWRNMRVHRNLIYSAMD